ncbi:MAG TPA: thiazole synthase [Burkholderiales bacterium]|nr:thiazole synthase [Burkholderiales bacterium]
MWKLADSNLQNRFLLGSAGYPSLQILKESIIKADIEIITVSLTRVKFNSQDNQFFELISSLPCKILPNTAGCYRAIDAVNTAKLAREVFKTNWIKLEVIGDDYTLQPNSLELIKATEILINDGFMVFPYCIDDVIVCQELVNLGCEILMPMASPIGSGQGLLNKFNLALLRERFPDINLIIDAGIGKPSHAAEAMEMGFDGILLNSAVSNAINPIDMALAFNLAIKGGRIAYESGLMPAKDFAVTSTPYFNRPFSEIKL